MGDGKPECDCGRAGEGVSGDRRRPAAAPHSSRPHRRRGRGDSRISLGRDRAGFAGAGRGLRQPGHPVCGPRGRSQPRTGASHRPRIEPAPAGAATADRSVVGLTCRRRRGPGDCESSAGRIEPLASRCREPSGGNRGRSCLRDRPGAHAGQCAAVRVGSGAAGLAQQSVTGDEEWACGINPLPPICPA